MKPTVFCIALLLTIVLHGRAFAQWEIVAPELTGPPTSFYCVFGCMEYKEGIVWAGSVSIWKSLDTGKTWLPSSDTLGEVRSLTFFNRDIGAVCIGAGGVLRTTDQGRTWREILDIGYSNAVVFGDTPDDIMITFHDGGGVGITRDGGRNWEFKSFHGFTTHAIKDKLGRIVVIVGGSTVITEMASIFISTDFGTTWTDMEGTFDHDTWSIAADSCNPDRFYVSNEEVLAFTNGFSEVFLTSNAGTSWTSAFSEENLLSGSIVSGANTIYPTSQKRGVIRSTDRGATWRNIGGPSATFDSRCLTLINDNIVFGLDTMGNIWRTMNAGGDSVTLPNPRSMTMSMVRPFDDETPFICDLPIGRNIALSPSCNARIKAIRIAGENPQAFHILDHPDTPQAGDSIWLSFNVDEAGEYTAMLEVEMENGEILRLPLHAIAKPPAIARLMDIVDIRNDTIGGTIRVPIGIESDGPMPSGEFSITFDSSVLVYKGTSSLAGDPLDIPGSPMAEVARVRFAAMPSGGILGYAYFEYYPLRDSCTEVRIDSLRFDDDPSLCVTLAEDAASANICTSIGCGTMLLSHYIRYGNMPDITLSPNPASSSIVLHSKQDVGEITVEVFDATGVLHQQFSGKLEKGSGLTIHLIDAPSGTYYARVATSHAVRTLRFVRR